MNYQALSFTAKQELLNAFLEEVKKSLESKTTKSLHYTLPLHLFKDNMLTIHALIPEFNTTFSYGDTVLIEIINKT